MSFQFTDDPILAFEAEFSKASKAYADLVNIFHKSPSSATSHFQASTFDPTAMSLATASGQGIPSVRTVLFKGLVRGGFSFYTNYESTKGQNLKAQPAAALLFFWPVLEQQIRIEGQVEKLTRQESEAYFKSRPRESQIGAWASEQSKEIPDQNWLIQRFAEFEKKFTNEVPCPPNWGGYRLEPLTMEFWFGKPGRLHERYVYIKTATGWRKARKSP